MKAEDRYETIEKELKNLITPLSETEQDLLMKAIRWAVRDNKCGNIHALHKLLVWQDPETNVGGIWCVDDIDARLEYLQNCGWDTSCITPHRKEAILDAWYTYMSENDSGIWDSFVESRLEFYMWLDEQEKQKPELQPFSASPFADENGDSSWENMGGVWFDDGELYEWIEDSRGLSEEEANDLASRLNSIDAFCVPLRQLDMNRVEQEIAKWEKNNEKL